MHELGIYSRLDQAFDAPAAVKDVLTSQFGLEHSVRLELPWSYIYISTEFKEVIFECV